MIDADSTWPFELRRSKDLILPVLLIPRAPPRRRRSPCAALPLSSSSPQIPPSYCVKLVEVMRELQRRRQGSAVFAGKDGFITARDLLRCAPLRLPQRWPWPLSNDEQTR